ncbi:uncharacterized protein LOC125369273 [Ricinus communis]|uniref:uncharacterized protein LOC125369273 n=1 Tax=Ricinus communis TaxID=3988 RepID=UPI00201AB778|nr:uncharacterized protein LOC125369273 [Ricinus communis]
MGRMARACPRYFSQPAFPQGLSASATGLAFPLALGYFQGGSQFVIQQDCGFGARVLLDHGATHSFVSPSFALRLDVQPVRLQVSMLVITLLSDALEIDVVFPSCPVSVEGQDLIANLILLDVMDFDIILEMDWSAMQFSMLDCREKQVAFRIPRDSEFHFKGEQVPTPSNLMSVITARRMLHRGCQGYLALVKDTSIGKGSVEDVQVVYEYPDVFPEELPRLPPNREIDFCIDMVPGTSPISLPPYRMAPAELKKLNE